MPKKEEILEKNNKVNKEKISRKATVLEESKNTKVEKKTKKETENKATKKIDSKVAKNDTKTKTTKKDSTKTEVKAKNKPKTVKKLTKETPKKETTKTTLKNEVKETTVRKKDEKLKQDKKTVEDKKIETKVDELSVIEKIKSFIAKIAAMQEESIKEVQAEKEETEKKVARKNTKKTKTEKEVKKIEYMLEYYDLPYRYNETIVKILAQTPKRMFVYWDISDSDREKYIKTFGEDFFEKTYPVLLLYNEDKKYVKEITINDFANSWYIDIPDSKTKYSIQLGRKFKQYGEIVNINIQKIQENKIVMYTDYLPFANSNVLEIPNDHILLENLPRFVTFRNVKSNEEKVVELKLIENTYGSYDVKDFYEEHYKNEIKEGMFDMENPSSNLSSSSFK